MSRVRRPPVQHQLAPVFDRAVDSLCASLSPDTTRHYRGTTRNFLLYLGTEHPQLNSLDQLRRQPHILGWMSHLHAQSPPLGTASYINLLISLRCIFNELAWTEQLYELVNLIRHEGRSAPPQKAATPTHNTTGSSPPTRVSPPQRFGRKCFSADPSHWHAHR
jgi:hypothetical protein